MIEIVSNLLTDRVIIPRPIKGDWVSCAHIANADVRGQVDCSRTVSDTEIQGRIDRKVNRSAGCRFTRNGHGRLQSLLDRAVNRLTGLAI